MIEGVECSTIKSLRKVWMRSERIRELSLWYFKSRLPVIAIMESERISSPSSALKFIPSFIRGIMEPENFVKLKWN
jgi:hypothetical protein